MKLTDEQNWLQKGHLDPRTPEQKIIDLEKKFNDVSTLCLKLHAKVEELSDYVHKHKFS